MGKFRPRRVVAIAAALATIAALALTTSATTAQEAPPSATGDPAPIAADDTGMSAAELGAIEADHAAEVADLVDPGGDVIVPQGTNAALKAANRGAAVDDDNAGLTVTPVAVQSDTAESARQINVPSDGTSSAISFADSDNASAGDTVLPPYVQLEVDTAARSRVVSVDTGQLAADLDAADVSVELFDDVTVQLATTVAPSPGEMGSTMYGATDGDAVGGDEYSIVTIAGDQVIAQWWKDNTQYAMFPTGSGADHVIVEVARDFPDDPEADQMVSTHDNGPSGLTDPDAGPDDEDLTADTLAAPNIEVMVAYDTEAAAFYGNNIDTIRLNAIAMVNLTNVTYINSVAGQNMTLTHIYATGVAPTTNSTATYRNQLANKTDGTFDGVHTSRDANGSDMIVLLSNRFTTVDGLCGIAFFPTSANPAENDAYNVTEASCAITGLTFPHELGHNQCAGHDVTGGLCTIYPDDTGHVDAGAGNRTIMARNSNTCCTRLPVWSNPGNSFSGWVTGVAGVSDNHRVLEEEDLSPGTISGGVASYRAGVGSNTAVAGTDGVSCAFSTLEDAFALAPTGSTIYVAPGTYQAVNTGLNFNITRDMDVVQGTATCGATATPVSNAVILEPAPGTLSDAVLEISGSADVTLDTITVQGSVASEGTIQVFSGAELTLDDAIVRNANTTTDGAGVRVLSGGTLTSVNNSQIENNTTTANGGGIWADNATINLIGLGDVDNNSAANGGGIYAVNNTTITMTSDSDVLANAATVSGGGVYLDASFLTMTGSGVLVGLVGANANSAGSGGGGVFATNSAKVTINSLAAVNGNTADFAGGVRVQGSAEVEINDDGAIRNNVASGLGGGGIYASSPATVDLNAGGIIENNSTTGGPGGGIRTFDFVSALGTGGAAGTARITGNTSVDDGGGIWGSGANIDLDTVTMTGNSAVDGGALFASGSSDVDITETTGCSSLGVDVYCNELSSNTASGNGGAIYTEGAAALDVVQTGFKTNASTLGGAINLHGTGIHRIRASMFIANTGAGGDGVVQIEGNVGLTIIGVTFVDHVQLAMDTDGAITPTMELSRIITDNGTLGLTGTISGSCNLSQGSSSLPGAINNNPRFEATAVTNYAPAPTGAAADRCALLNGFGTDAVDVSVIDSDGLPTATDYEIGGIEVARQPLITPGGIGGPEGSGGGVTVFPVPVRLDFAGTAPITVDWQTFDNGNPGIATEGVDYLPPYSGTVTFPPGSTEETVFINVVADNAFETNLFLGEWLPIVFSNPSVNAELDVQSFFGFGLAIIANDD